ncbi:MAG: winged helix-turn-helix transcriptional regulator [Saprospiraceae bacterium]|nr:winged helix-turn-helix transcriptional regulator [Saprospiraceae bacterium]
MRRDVFQAIADPVRREIIALLSQDIMSIKAISAQFEISRPAVSKHVKILQECGLIKITQQGRERFCEIQPAELVPAFLWLDQYRDLWEDRLDSFEAYLHQIKKEKNE